ncbi:MAG: hypothetical protein KIT09_17470 [Bryobacteraceae bacterium]|nr:hypothetical protein [Bryobacteraceae bacterium]
MAYSINTNVTSLQAQDYLRISSEFQSKTINRVTSGLRIISSGDDAAGLAIANSLRSDRAVITQGVRNANDGLSTLQTIDGGINNISQLLDRARTLAAQSASGTFSGNRNVLNSEFESVILEIDRQAQAIGLDQGGSFAKNLTVFIGGGRSNSGVSEIANGSLSVDLSQSTVDSKSLGLKGVQALGAPGTDIGTGSVSTSVGQILADLSNLNDLTTANYTVFKFYGPGFGDGDGVAISVNTQGVTDTDTLVTAINAAIESAGNGGSTAATAFKNANIVASVNTDSAGRKQLAFSSSSTAFQVKAGDKMANALMGNFGVGATGADMSTTVTADVASAAGSAAFGAAGAGDIVFRFQGAGMTSPLELTVSVAAATTVAEAIADLSTQVVNNATLKAAGISLTSASAGSALEFTSTRSEQFDVQVSNDKLNHLGFGSFLAGVNAAFDYASITASANYSTASVGSATFEVSINGGASNTNAMVVNLAGGDATAATVSGTDTALTVDTTGGANLFRLAVDGSVYAIALTANATASKITLANDINTAVGATIASVGADGKLVLASTTKGAASTIQILAGTANAVLGFTEGDVVTGASRSGASVADALNAAIAADAELSAAGLVADFGVTAAGKISINSSNGTYFRLNTFGDVAAATAMGTKAATYDTTGGNNVLTIAVDGGLAQTVTLTAGAARTAAQIVQDINDADIGVTASVVTHGGVNFVQVVSDTTGAASSLEFGGTARTIIGFAATAYDGTEANAGYGVAGQTFAGNVASAAPATAAQFNAGGSQATAALAFQPLAYGNDDQTITISANDNAGVQQSKTIVLKNDGASDRYGRNIDQVLDKINADLQQTNNQTLQKIVAVKVNDGGVEKIQFLSSLGAFQVSIGQTPDGNGIGAQGSTQSSQALDGGSVAAIDTQAGGEAAVAALANAVAALGEAQAVVGKGQNRFNFAVNLAQTQLNNLAASESRIRDADLALEAANLTKAQIMQQAGIAALAQANSAPQTVLSLLRG